MLRGGDGEDRAEDHDRDFDVELGRGLLEPLGMSDALTGKWNPPPVTRVQSVAGGRSLVSARRTPFQSGRAAGRLNFTEIESSCRASDHSFPTEKTRFRRLFP